ncbi:MAG: hypothetical protein NTX50_25080 [Candidatus Sumerlaeota bacterium]|nr:hypothetical protein [Candidatus Sumerlaeota bacterium]
MPAIVRADQEATITLQPLKDGPAFDPAAPYIVTHIPVEGFGEKGQWAASAAPVFRVENGAMLVTSRFDREQEHVLLVEIPEGEKRKVIAEAHIYSLEKDLLALRPFKGDFHIHSDQSDGREPPAYVAGACRRIGLDFMALTDHHKYQPSLDARDAYKDAPIDLKIFAGEEVHPPDCPTHIVHFGGRSSVNDLFKDNPRFLAGVKAIQDTLGDLPAGVNPYQYATCLWTFDQIRKAGGFGIFAHPYWIHDRRYVCPEPLSNLLLEKQPFDALELVGGYDHFEIESNLLQVARYQEERAKGRRTPIVGVSDAHGCETGKLFGWYYTILFAPSLDLDSIISSLLDLRSVAVEALPNEAPRAHGPWRLVKYAQFLIREIFPAHDALCREEGLAMLAYSSAEDKNTTQAREAIAELNSMKGVTIR